MTNLDLIEKNELSSEAKGGTEIMMERIYSSLSRDLLKEVQIIPSRVRTLSQDKVRIFYAHDLAGDPEADAAVGNGEWYRFHRCVFVSNWQMQQYINHYKIPWSKCKVILNAIEPISLVNKTQKEPIKLIYTSTPHRGLDVLCGAFEHLQKNNKAEGVHLEVFSSFGIYGSNWVQRDQDFKPLIDWLNDNPQATYHNSVSNEELRSVLQQADIFAYPSTWPETSSLCLMEAMSAGLLCAHSNFGALAETAANTTFMYQFHEDKTSHAVRFAGVLMLAIEGVRKGWERDNMAKQYADRCYNWENRKNEWKIFLEGLLKEPRELNKPEERFIYRS